MVWRGAQELEERQAQTTEVNVMRTAKKETNINQHTAKLEEALGRLTVQTAQLEEQVCTS